MATDNLTHTAIRSARARKKLFDGGGLYLLLTPPGPPERPKASAYWRLKYRVDGVEKLISLGQYPAVSLEAARRKRHAARKLLDDGTDPSAKRKADKSARLTAKQNTFEALAREWLSKKGRKWAPSNASKIQGRFDNYLFPLLGSLPVTQATSDGLADVLKKIERTGTVETAHRCRQYINAVFRYAVQTGRLTANPTPHAEILTPVQSGRFASLTKPEDIGALLRAIQGYSGSIVVQSALRLAPLLFVRPGELRAASWDEIDLDAGEWKIKPERMKMRRPHIVPLSRQALEILRDLPRLTGTGVYVFPSERGGNRPMSENTLNAALRVLGFGKEQMTAHGFRHMASTLLHDSRKWRSEVIERQMAHADRNAVRAVYNAAEYLQERTEMMQWWADRLDALAAARNVTQLAARA